MHRSSEFGSVVRGGARAGARTLVLHQRTTLRASDEPAVVGLVVSRSVGNSVIRHRVSRRLRAVLAARLDSLPAGSGTVVRALPPAASASSAALAADLDRAGRALARRQERTR